MNLLEPNTFTSIQVNRELQVKDGGSVSTSSTSRASSSLVFFCIFRKSIALLPCIAPKLRWPNRKSTFLFCIPKFIFLIPPTLYMPTTPRALFAWNALQFGIGAWSSQWILIVPEALENKSILNPTPHSLGKQWLHTTVALPFNVRNSLERMIINELHFVGSSGHISPTFTIGCSDLCFKSSAANIRLIVNFWYLPSVVLWTFTLTNIKGTWGCVIILKYTVHFLYIHLNCILQKHLITYVVEKCEICFFQCWISY